MSGFKGAYRSMGYSDYENIILTPLQYSSVIKGTWTTDRNAVYLSNYIIYNTTGSVVGGVLDEIVFNQTLSGGIYNFIISFNRSTNTAITQMLIDGIPYGNTFDTYGAASSAITQTFNNVMLEAGLHTISFRVTGKNAASSAYYFVFQQLIIQRIG